MSLLRSLTIVCLLGFAASAPSQVRQASSTDPQVSVAQPEKMDAPTAAVEPPVPLLWKVSDADNAVYILGSFHLLKPGDYPLSPDVDTAFRDAERLVFEMSPEEMASPTLPLQMGQAGMRTDGSTLDSELKPEVAAALARWLEANASQPGQMGLTPQAMQRLEPWFAGLTISLVEMAKLGMDPRLGLDTHFAQKAKAAGKPTAGLETGAQQIAMLDSMSRDEQVQMLTEALDESEEGRAQVDELHRLWRAGDADAIWRDMAVDMRAKYPKLYRAINVDRNAAWVPEIEQWLKNDKDDTLLVVGALHALGDDGVVSKLEGRGYEVERVCSACQAIPSAASHGDE